MLGGSLESQVSRDGRRGLFSKAGRCPRSDVQSEPAPAGGLASQGQGTLPRTGLLEN